MSIKNPSDGVISIGEPIERSQGSLELNRITVPHGPWVWNLKIRDPVGLSVAGIDLTTVDLQKLRDLIAKAIVMAQAPPQ